MLTCQPLERHNENILSLVSKVCAKMSLADIGSECEQVREVLKDTGTMFSTLQDASTADLSQVLGDVKKYAAEVVTQDWGDPAVFSHSHSFLVLALLCFALQLFEVLASFRLLPIILPSFCLV